MRPISQHNSSLATPKPSFQTKFKSRVSSNEIEDWHSATHSRKFSQTHRDMGFKLQKDDHFNKTASRLLQSNFEHLDAKAQL